MSIATNPTAAQQLRSTRLWFASRSHLAALQEEFCAHWRSTVGTLGRDEVHDLRVASRRLREGLALFSAVLPRGKAAKLSRKVKRVTRCLGELRNTDEALLFFSSLAPGESSGCRLETDQLVLLLARRQEQARERLRHQLAGWNPRGIGKSFRALLRPNPFKRRPVDPFGRTGPFAGEALARRLESVQELFPAALREEDVVAQHRLRIACKKLRYRLEILSPLLEDEGEELRRLLKRYQDILGKQHDLDVFAELVLERVPEGTGREELLRLLARQRALVFARFLETLREQPLEPLTARVREELGPQSKAEEEAPP